MKKESNPPPKHNRPEPPPPPTPRKYTGTTDQGTETKYEVPPPHEMEIAIQKNKIHELELRLSGAHGALLFFVGYSTVVTLVAIGSQIKIWLSP
jgi:hypothetical protein